MDEEMKLKNRMVSIFKRKGREGQYARLFDHLDQWQKNLLLTEMPLEQDEVPVIGGVEGQEKWFLITTKRIVWQAKDLRHSIPINRVFQISLDFN